MTLMVPDRPGQLLKALEPVAKNGGNIISIIHDRNKVSGKYALVSLIADFPSRTHFIKTREELKKLGISIAKSEEVVEKEDLSILIIGRFDLNNIMGNEKIQIVDVELSKPSSEETCMRLHLEIPKESVEEIFSLLREIAERENALIITPV